MTVLAIPSPLTPDPAGAKNVGNGAGQQFIGGACLSSKDCGSACCATLNGAGICSGTGAQFQAGKTGCGFGDGGAATATTPATNANAGSAGGAASSGSGTAPAAAAINSNAAGAQNVGKGNGQQFITGQCLSDADCASACCAKPSGVCSAVAVAFDSGKQGCGFVGTA